MHTLITPLLARLSSETGILFTLTPAGTIEIAEDDALKVAAVVDLAKSSSQVRSALTCSELAQAMGYARPGEDFAALVTRAADTVMGQSRERVAKDLADKRTAAEQEKLAEAGRKSWATRRKNEAAREQEAASVAVRKKTKRAS